MLLYLSVNGIILSALLLYFNGRKFPSTIYLSLFFFSICLYGVIQYAMLYSKSVFLNAIFLIHFSFILYLTGPAIYLYIRSILSDNYRLYRRDIWHLVPMVVYLISVLPYYFKPFSEKIAIAQEIVKDLGFLSVYKFSWLAELFSNSFVYLSRPLLALFYIVWSIGMFIRFLKYKDDQWVLSGQKFMIKWLCIFLGSSLLLVLSQFVLMVFTWQYGRGDMFFTMNTLQLLSVIGLTILLISPFFFPEILYGMPRLPVLIPTHESAPETYVDLAEVSTKYIPKFETDYLNMIRMKIDSAMRIGQPDTYIDFNMSSFSVLLDVPLHHLSYYFREVKKQSFNDFRNDWRIYCAKKLMLEGKAEELTLDAIGIKSGFTSRSSFFRAFKKAEGIAPGEFLAKMSPYSHSK